MKIPLNRSIRYRPEIDGLRAVAVIPVILFHAGFDLFSGGFVGVDVFFVISGYLITSILVEDLRNNRFSIITFYTRRFRRLLPALVVLLIFWYVVVWLFGLPNEIKDYGQSMFSAAGFVANIYFYLKVDYFNPIADDMLLLHTWSLSVEEQFYIFFPIFLWLLWKQRLIGVAGAILLTTVASFLLAQKTVSQDQTLAFYMLHTRAWELLVGSFLGVVHQTESEKKPTADSSSTTNELLSLLGLLLIAASVLFYDKNTLFPSYFTILPVLGTALIVHYCHERTLAGRLLSFKPVVLIGLISYSAYLWHQPIIAFSKSLSPTPLGTAILLLLSTLSLVVAYSSWRYVEVPARKFQYQSGPKLISVSIVILATTALIGLFAHFNSELRAKGTLYEAHLKGGADSPNYGLTGPKYCPTNSSPDLDEKSADTPYCRTSNEAEIFLWGDSFAMHLAQFFEEGEPGLVQASKASCFPNTRLVPFDGSATYNLDWAKRCFEYNNKALKYALDDPFIKTIVISSTFTWPLKFSAFDGTTADNRKTADYLEAMRHDIELIRAAGKSVVIVGPTPQGSGDFNFTNCARKLLVSTKAGEVLPQSYIAECNFRHPESKAYEFIEKLSGSANVNFIDLRGLLCSDQGLCSPFLDETLVYYDWGHLSPIGAATIQRKYNILDSILAAAR